MRSLPFSCLAALFCCAAGALPAWCADSRLDDAAVPEREQVTLELDPSSAGFRGQVTIALRLKRPSATLQFNGLDYTITRARVDGAATCNLAAVMNPQGVVTATCPAMLPAGRYQLRIEFTAPYNRRSVGLYKTVDRGSPYLFTQFEMSDARRAFPVFDEPRFKIPFQLTVRAPRAMRVYSNTLVKVRRDEGDWAVHEFAPTLPIPSYLVALAVGDFDELPVPGMRVPARIITTRGKTALAQQAAREMPAIMAALEGWFGRPYPYPKLDAVAVPEFPFGAMENAGLITYREDVLLVDAAHASSQQLQRVASVQAHEMAHQWFGDLVTMKWWNDLWLNEAFATWMAARLMQALHPEFETQLSLPQNNVLAQDALATTLPIRKPVQSEADINDGLALAYSKGSVVLGMVEQWIGAAAFRQGVQRYLDAHAFGNADASDLWRALGAASRRDVATVLRPFLEQPAFPLIGVTLEGRTLRLDQQRYVLADVAAPALTWAVPVSIKYGKGNVIRTTNVLMNRAVATVRLEFAPDWVYPDAGALGYYRIALADSLRHGLLANLNERNLTAAERKSLAYQIDALLAAGRLSGADYLAALAPFLDDAHPRVVSAALSLLRSRREALGAGEHAAAWNRAMQALSRSALARYGLHSRPDDPMGADEVRNQLIPMLGLEGADPLVIATAKEQALVFLEDASRADAALVDSYLAVASFHADATLYHRMQAVFETTADLRVRSSLLRAMSRVGDPVLQQEALDYLLSEHIAAADLRYCFEGHRFPEARQARMRDWVYRNYDALARKMPPFFLPELPMQLGKVCGIEEFSPVQAFFAPKAATVPGFARSLAKAGDGVQQCANLHRREQAAVDSYLDRYAPPAG